jgi:hypothetical protein
MLSDWKTTGVSVYMERPLRQLIPLRASRPRLLVIIQDTGPIPSDARCRNVFEKQIPVGLS